jgi:alkanesulfonate monooxygenase SsuD/methylene tetrahydromethanopterin reductase-like flavin-dependent oxidoreductase (luciferase family)
VRVGITLPTFRDDTLALVAARRAEELGLDGVFVFDHLWPMGAPERPALSAFPVLGAVAAATRRVSFGPLVARIGLVPDEILVAELLSLSLMAPGRVIAGLGTGDSKSAAENIAFGVPFDPPDERRVALRQCARHVLGAGIPVWVGGGSPSTVELAVELDAAVNLWEGQPAAVAGLQPRCEVTWAGPVAGEVPEIAQWLEEVAGAGATWAVCAWPESIEAVAEAAAFVRGS